MKKKIAKYLLKIFRNEYLLLKDKIQIKDESRLFEMNIENIIPKDDEYHHITFSFICKNKKPNIYLDGIKIHAKKNTPKPKGIQKDLSSSSRKSK